MISRLILVVIMVTNKKNCRPCLTRYSALSFVATFSSQSFQEGQVHFDFTTHYSGDHGDLVDFQPHRRLFGVSENKPHEKKLTKVGTARLIV
jgi:hypothetical protein